MDERRERGYVPVNRHDPVAPTLAAHHYDTFLLMKTMTNNFTMHYFFTLCSNVPHWRLLKVPAAFVENFIVGHRRVSSSRSSPSRS
jgi:hypothetical protein